MKWCLKCQAENVNDATTCVKCTEAFPPPLTGWKYVFYMALLAALVIGSVLLLRYLKANGYISGWLADQV